MLTYCAKPPIGWRACVLTRTTHMHYSHALLTRTTHVPALASFKKECANPRCKELVTLPLSLVQASTPTTPHARPLPIHTAHPPHSHQIVLVVGHTFHSTFLTADLHRTPFHPLGVVTCDRRCVRLRMSRRVSAPRADRRGARDVGRSDQSLITAHLHLLTAKPIPPRAPPSLCARSLSRLALK